MSQLRVIKSTAGEIAVIAGSILLAFWVDAWWDGQLAHRAEREMLSAVAEEVERNRNEVSAAIDRTDRQLAMVDEFLRATPDEFSTWPPERTSATISSLYRIQIFSPVNGAAVRLVGTPPTEIDALRTLNEATTWLQWSDELAASHQRIEARQIEVTRRLSAYAARDHSNGLQGRGTASQVMASGSDVLADLWADKDFIASVLEKASANNAYRGRLARGLTLLESFTEALAGESPR